MPVYGKVTILSLPKQTSLGNFYLTAVGIEGSDSLPDIGIMLHEKTGQSIHRPLELRYPKLKYM